MVFPGEAFAGPQLLMEAGVPTSPHEGQGLGLIPSSAVWPKSVTRMTLAVISVVALGQAQKEMLDSWTKTGHRTWCGENVRTGPASEGP